MANVISSISNANTFGDWLVATNALIFENNAFATSRYVKPIGTLVLNDTSLGLQVANNAIFGGYLQVVGLGSAAYVQNNFQVGGQVYFSNTTLGLTNSGTSIFQGTAYLTGPGLSLSVANNTTMSGTLNVAGTTTISNSLFVSANTTTNYLTVNLNTTTQSLNVSTVGNIYTTYTNQLFTGTMQATGAVSVAGPVTFTNPILGLTNSGNAVFGGIVTINGSGTALSIANNALVSGTLTIGNGLNVTGSLNAGSLSTTGSTTTGSLTVLQGTTANTVTANSITASAITVANLTVSGTTVSTGTVINSSNTFLLSSGVVTPITSYYGVYRSGGSYQTAYLRWNETSKFWDLNDVTNGNFYRILTDEYRSDSTTTPGTTNVASSNAVYTLQQSLNTTSNIANTASANTLALFGIAQTQNTWISSNAAYSNASFSTANLALQIANYANNTANIATANLANVIYLIVPSFNQANNALNVASYANNTANIAAANISIIFGIDQTQNSWISSNALYTQAAFNTANTANNTANIATSNLANLTITVTSFYQAHNANIIYFQNVANTINTNIIVIGGVDNWQNNWISNVSNTVNAAFTEANNTANLINSGNLTSLTINTYGTITTTNAYLTSTAQATIDTFSNTQFRSAEYLLQLTEPSTTNYHTIKILMVQNGTSVYMTEYGEIYTGVSLISSLDASITSGNVNLLFTPTQSPTSVKLMRTALIL